MAPALEPTITSGRMPASSRTLITPTCAKPRGPPPPSTSATRGGFTTAGSKRGWRSGGTSSEPLQAARSSNAARSDTTRCILAARLVGDFARPGDLGIPLLVLHEHARSVRVVAEDRAAVLQERDAALRAIAELGALGGVLGVGLRLLAAFDRALLRLGFLALPRVRVIGAGTGRRHLGRHLRGLLLGLRVRGRMLGEVRGALLVHPLVH